MNYCYFDCKPGRPTDRPSLGCIVGRLWDRRECRGLHLTFPGEKISLKFAQIKSILFFATIGSQTHSLDSTVDSKIFSGTMDKATPCRFLSWHSVGFELGSLFGRLRPSQGALLVVLASM